MDDAQSDLDRLIDGALASYSDAEPLAGLEQRVENRVRVARNRRRWLAWGVGAAGAASVVIVGIVIWTERRVVVPKAHEVARVTNVAPPATVIQRAVRIPVHVRAKRPKALPKLEQFPAPEPMTAEERAFVAFVTRDPTEAQQILADMRKRADAPIEIQPIQIPPLQSDGAQ